MLKILYLFFFSGAAPDVVRLGDINLYDDSDDMYAQQLKIVEIIRHPEHRFSSRYHDLALLRLERNVVLHDTVAPGCLWNDDEIPFPSMEATGWGTTGFGQGKTPILLKVALSVVPQSECDKQYRKGDRGLRQGLQDYHLCAGDIKMDTCPGDSGGPLQMKLLANAKITPFIIAVTSFGGVCGQSIPGVYMKVSSYIPWIRAELAKRGESIQEWSFKPYACALRYVHLRDYEDDVVISKSDTFESLDSTKAHMSIIKSAPTVKIHYPAGVKEPDNCYGVIIDEDTVVTLAHCAGLQKMTASYVADQNNTRNEVVKVHRHPRYRPNSYDNDIAILKLKNRYEFSQKFVPACIWSDYKLPDGRFYVTGQGRLDLNEFSYSSNSITEFKPQIVQLAPRADLQLQANCSIPSEYQARLANGLTQEHLCFGNKPFLVPESCQLQIGAPLWRRVWRMGRHFEHIYALNLFGKDCGFGRSAAATRLGHHHEWMKSVLLPNYKEADDAVHFINSDLDENDPCTAADGSEGLCKYVQRCPKIAYDAEAKRDVRLCNDGSLVCCPYEYIRNETRPSAGARELDECENRYRTFHEEYQRWQQDRIKHYYHMVYVGWEKGMQTDWSCPGTLISRSLVVLSAYCLTGSGTRPTVVNVGMGNPNETWYNPIVARIREVIIHPNYNASSLLHDIGLVRLEQDIVPTARKYPICLWQNETHTPFLLHRMVIDEGESRFVESYPKYNSDCKEYLGVHGSRKLYPSELCVDVNASGFRSLTGDPLVWYKRKPVDNSSLPHLVGMISYGNTEDELFVHTRVSSYFCGSIAEMWLRIVFTGWLVVFGGFAASADGYKILFLVPFPGPSHWLMLKHVIRELTDRQHEVTCITTFPYGEPLSNYEEVLIDPPYPMRKTFPVEELFAASQTSDISKVDMYWEMGLNTSRYGLQSPNVRQFIERTDLSFDLVISEQFFQESWLVFAHKYSAPIVTISTYGYSDFFDQIMGLRTPWSFVPHMVLSYTDDMTLFQRMYNFAISSYDAFFRQFYLLEQDVIAREAFGQGVPSVTALEQSISVILVNSHPIVSIPRPTMRGLVDIGGAHIRPPKPLPDELAAFMEGARHGVIYFSLGAYMQSSVMPVAKRSAILRVFGTLQQRVVWKFEDDSIPPGDIPPNVMVRRWAPQNDILAHPATVLFISHGGQFGTFEAMHHGVPVLFIPFFGDQHRNAKRARMEGFAEMMSFEDITEDSFGYWVRHMLEQEHYRVRAKEISHQFTDRLVEPMDEALYWIEYVARHRGAPRLKSKAVNLNWVGYYSLDIVLVPILLLMLLWLVTN
uniref:Peptidase S1 domain-containing protein n=1 Tax=Anopheles epiroticus TaxID=199890 RepID=A0A182PLT1_9DIPT